MKKKGTAHKQTKMKGQSHSLIWHGLHLAGLSEGDSVPLGKKGNAGRENKLLKLHPFLLGELLPLFPRRGRRRRRGGGQTKPVQDRKMGNHARAQQSEYESLFGLQT